MPEISRLSVITPPSMHDAYTCSGQGTPGAGQSLLVVYLPFIVQPGASMPQPSPIDTNQLCQDAINAVNVQRAQAGCAPVVENASLDVPTQAWSDYLEANNILEHSSQYDANWYVEHGDTRTELKVLKRRCYGLRNVGRLFQRLTLDVKGSRRFSPWRTATY